MDLQKIGVDQAVSSRKTDGATHVESTATPTTPVTVPFSVNNPDIQANQYPIFAADLESLATQGSLSLPHPEGGILNIVLRATSTKHGSRTLHVTSNGYPGTITQRADGFFATLATAEGTYTLENRGSVTYLVPQRQLDLRINPALRDFAHAPST